MCRWLAYVGPPIEMAALVLRPQHSLVRQSLSAQRGVTPVNGDGFGLAWWASKREPGQFRDTLPAWNDANLRSLTEQIASPCFFAHVRASTGTETSRANCHPFTFGRWAFMHNGQIGDWHQVRRAVEAHIPDKLFIHRQGTTDTEALFLLAVAQGLPEDPLGGLARAVGIIYGEMQAASVAAPFRMTAALGDGRAIYTCRWSSDGQSPSLYTADAETIGGFLGESVVMKDAWLILSEPLDDISDGWDLIDEGSAVCVGLCSARQEPFRPLFA